MNKSWKFTRILTVPGTKIRNYFGEKIAFYFEFLSFYTIMLIFPSVLGIPVFIIQLIFEPGDDVYKWTLFVFGVLFILWMCVFYELWGRKEVYLSILWG